MADAFDHHMMGIALMLARRGLGTTAPNPSVGAVLVDPATGEVIARGTTAPGGRPHAERIAIERAGLRALGSTLYVTLEPCSHHGKTPPCAEAVIQAGVARVVCGVTDPDPRVAGRGIALLRAAGLAVEIGVRETEAADVTRGHILRVSKRRPFIQLKLALSLNGSVPQGTGTRPVFVTGEIARAVGHLMRARADAILVGAGTVRADNPDLTCRLPGHAHRSPIRIVLARSWHVLAGTRLAASAREVPVWVYESDRQAGASTNEPFEPGIIVRSVPAIDGHPWLPAVTENLAQNGITRLLVEGGPTMWRAFATRAFADEVVMFVAGGGELGDEDALRFVRRHLGALPLEPAERHTLGPDGMWRLTVSSNAPPASHSSGPS